MATIRFTKQAASQPRLAAVNISSKVSVRSLFMQPGPLQLTPYFIDRSTGHGLFTQPRFQRGYFAPQVGQLYNFPAGADGAGQCIGIISMDGSYNPAHLQQYFSHLGMAVPSITAVSVGGAHNQPLSSAAINKELMLDIQVAGSIAPGARLVIYFAPNNEHGFVSAIRKAVNDKKNKPGIISISWGAPECKWSRQALEACNEVFRSAADLDITVCVASGNCGSSGGLYDGRVHVDFPASSPYVLACGGTRLTTAGSSITSEVVWHEADHAASGGGVSEVFPIPDYQLSSGIPLSLNPSRFRGRGVPDVAGNAAHTSGYKIIVNGKPILLGGTSAVAPLYAGLIALRNQLTGHNAGFINPYLYSNPSFFRPILHGNNCTTHPKLGYRAAPGWNACTGLGVLDPSTM